MQTSKNSEKKHMVHTKLQCAAKKLLHRLSMTTRITGEEHPTASLAIRQIPKAFQE